MFIGFSLSSLLTYKTNPFQKCYKKSQKNFTRISSSFFHYKRNARYKNTGHNIIRNFFLFLSLFLFFVQTSTIEPVAALLINYTNGSVSCSYSGSFAFFPEAEAKLFDGRYPSICRSIQVISTSTTYSCSSPVSSRPFGIPCHFSRQPRQQQAQACWARIQDGLSSASVSRHWGSLQAPDAYG